LTTITQLDPISRIENVNSDWRDLNWVDKFNTLGLGSNVPFKARTHFANSSTSDKNDNVFCFGAMIAFLPQTKKFVIMRVPYPLGFCPVIDSSRKTSVLNRSSRDSRNRRGE